MACVDVDSESYEFDLVRMQLSADIRVFTEANKVCCMQSAASF